MEESREPSPPAAPVRRAASAFRIGAAIWIVHCGLAIANGAVLIAWRNGVRIDLLALTPLLPALIVTASGGAAGLGLGLRALSRLSTGFAHPTLGGDNKAFELDPAWQRHFRDARIAAFLCFVSAGIGIATLGFFFVQIGAGDLAGTIALISLWFLVFAILAIAGAFGGDLFEGLLATAGNYDDPLHLFWWYAGLTVVFANWLLLGILLFFLNGVLLVIPFGLVPIIGIGGFRKIYLAGSLLLRSNPRLLFRTLKIGEPS